LTATFKVHYWLWQYDLPLVDSYFMLDCSNANRLADSHRSLGGAGVGVGVGLDRDWEAELVPVRVGGVGVVADDYRHPYVTHTPLS